MSWLAHALNAVLTNPVGGGWYDRSFAFRQSASAPPWLVGAAFAVHPAQIGEELLSGEGEFLDATLEEIPREGGLGGNDQQGRFVPGRELAQ